MKIKKISLMAPIFDHLAVFLILFINLLPSFLHILSTGWMAIVGHVLSGGWLYAFKGLSIFDILSGLQGRVFSNVLNYILFSLIPYNVSLLSIYSIITHAVNTYLVYVLAKKFLKNKLESFVASIFFLTNSVANQAIIGLPLRYLC